MKYLFASDIHGSAFYCTKLVERINKENPDKIVLLGDILYHGPRNDLPKEYNPKMVIASLNEYKDKIIAVRGNCDAEVDQMVLNFPIMDSYKVLKLDNFKVLISHGHVFGFEKQPKFHKTKVIIQGHTHVQVNKLVNGVYLLNPGSISIPKENSKNAYIIYENNEFTFKDLEGNIFDSVKIK